MRFSLQVQYAICALFDLAYNGHDEPLQVRIISERQEIPLRYLEQIFQRLRRAGLVASKRGPGGGYALARPASDVSLREVIEAVEGPLGQAFEMPPAESSEARPAFLWQVLAARLGRALEETSLEVLCNEAVRARIPREEPESPMYHI